MERVPNGKTMVVNCEYGIGCYTFPRDTTCKFSDACVDPTDPEGPGETMAALGGTVTGNGGECSLRCYMCDLRDYDYALDSFDMITKE